MDRQNALSVNLQIYLSCNIALLCLKIKLKDNKIKLKDNIYFDSHGMFFYKLV